MASDADMVLSGRSTRKISPTAVPIARGGEMHSGRVPYEPDPDLLAAPERALGGPLGLA